MWLINTESLELEFVDNPEDREYAILSHTWGPGEVSFQEMANLEIARTKPGFSKIKQTCKLAKYRDLSYAWVDTCCIDKSSSAELTEAINSMFRWYKESTVCFVYLSDLPSVSDWFVINQVGDGEELFLALQAALGENLPKCRWFTRGWTLQELIASKNVEFYDERWLLSGDKVSMRKQIWLITGIDEFVLENSDKISTVPVAKRMSWAAKRQTTRVEDLSYCLFGIFDVNLPLIYGEGTKAFLRLQEAIALENNDLSLFAWTSKSDEERGFRGVFALHPSEFQSCSLLEKATDLKNPNAVFSFTNKGFHITTRLLEGYGEYLMDLQCMKHEMGGSLYDRAIVRSGKRCFIRLLKTDDGFVRHESNKLHCHWNFKVTKEVSVYIPRKITHAQSDQLKLRRSYTFTTSFVNYSGLSVNCHFNGRPDHLWDQSISGFLTGGQYDFKGVLELTIKGTVNFGDEGISPAQFCWKGSALLGLEFGPSHGLVPWAAIYGRNNYFINSIIRREKEDGTLYALKDVRNWYNKFSKFPEELEFQPEWEFVSEGAERDYKDRWIKENQFWLHVSTKATGEGGKKHLLVLEVRGVGAQMSTRFLG